MFILRLSIVPAFTSLKITLSAEARKAHIEISRSVHGGNTNMKISRDGVGVQLISHHGNDPFHSAINSQWSVGPTWRS